MRKVEAKLTDQIKVAGTIEEVLHTCCANQTSGYLDHIHLSASWISLGRLARRDPTERQWLQAHTLALEPLVQQTIHAAECGEIHARGLANVAYGAAVSGLAKTLGELFTALARASECRVGEFTTQELANTAWAFATVGRSDPSLFLALAKNAVKRVNTFNAQDLANTAWAFATAGLPDAPLYAALAKAVKSRAFDFNAQGLANTAWAFAKAGRPDAALFDELAKAAIQRMSDFNAQGLANTAWAFARVRHLDALLFTALARTAEPRMMSFNAQNLANLAWAFATAGLSDASLFAALARAVERRVDDFNAQELANTAWAFATAGRQDAQLFAALARAMVRRIGAFNAQELANTAWAFAAAGQSDIPLFSKLGEAAEQRANEFKPTELRQLHQWVLWHQELKLSPPLSRGMRDRCQTAFQTNPCRHASKMQRDVAAALTDVGARVKEEVVIKEGYSIHVLAELEGERVAVEVSGPSHFVEGDEGRPTTNGATLLKRRQLSALGWRVVVVPYWEWDALKDNADKRREYLSRVLQSRGSSLKGDTSSESAPLLKPSIEASLELRRPACCPGVCPARLVRTSLAQSIHGVVGTRVATLVLACLLAGGVTLVTLRVRFHDDPTTMTQAPLLTA
jgi:hypothetical protein